MGRDVPVMLPGTRPAQASLAATAAIMATTAGGAWHGNPFSILMAAGRGDDLGREADDRGGLMDPISIRFSARSMQVGNTLPPGEIRGRAGLHLFSNADACAYNDRRQRRTRSRPKQHHRSGIGVPLSVVPTLQNIVPRVSVKAGRGCVITVDTISRPGTKKQTSFRPRRARSTPSQLQT